MPHQPTDGSRARQSGESNPNWKGGRSVASNGYILIRVGVGHPLTDVRGYAYEHRLVASQKIGRWLRSGEQVHHINGDKTDNRPENLKVCAGSAEHLVHHRTVGLSRRLPGESNPLVECRCGCGETFHRYDDSGRPRAYVSGHNPSHAPTVDAILTVLDFGPKHISVIVDETGIGRQSVAVALSKMLRRGQVVRFGRGVWGKSGGSHGA